MQVDQFEFINPSDGWITYSAWMKNGNLPRSTILHTTDGATRWTAYVLPADAAPATLGSGGTTIDFVNSSTGWMLAQDGLLRTTDGGRTWKWL